MKLFIVLCNAAENPPKEKEIKVSSVTSGYQPLLVSAGCRFKDHRSCAVINSGTESHPPTDSHQGELSIASMHNKTLYHAHARIWCNCFLYVEELGEIRL